MRTRPQGGSGLDNFLNSNPIVLLISAGVGVATVVAGAMSYLTSEKIQDLEIQHKTQMAELQEKNQADLLQATRPLQAKIEDLNFRMSSIERRLPGAGPSYLDVSTISIGPETLKALSTRYTSYDNDGFFVAVPNGSNWNFSLTNELDLLRSTYSFMNKLITDIPQYKIAAKAPVYLWESDSKVQIYAKADDDVVTFTFHPAIAVEHVDQALLKDRVKEFQDIDKTEARKGAASDKDIAAKVGTKLDNQKQGNPEQTSPNITIQAKQKTDKLIVQADEKQDVVNYLEKMGSSDVTNFELFDTMLQFFVQNVTFPLYNKIISLQKRGNVFYIQEQILFKNVDVTIDSGERKHLQNVSVDEEIFFISRGEDGYLIKIFLPPVRDRADNFAWSKSWLTGLQIPID